MFNAKEGAGPFSPAEACPTYDIAPEVQPLVSQRQARDEARFAELIGSGTPAMSYAHLDGGMHQSFRAMLKSLGPERMQPMVAGKVEISRPDAALADPFGGDDAPGRTDTTGSLAIR